jgi:hypothetical protein
MLISDKPAEVYLLDPHGIDNHGVRFECLKIWKQRIVESNQKQFGPALEISERIRWEHIISAKESWFTRRLKRSHHERGPSCWKKLQKQGLPSTRD